MLSRILDLLVSLAFIYLLLCIFVSGLNEWLAQKRGRRGKFLRKGLIRLIPDQAIYRRLIHHPLIESLYRERVAKGKMPSYISASDFALALEDVICTRAERTGPADPDKMAGGAAAPGERARSLDDFRAALRTLQSQGSPFATTLLPVLDRAEGDLHKARAGIERWFNEGMDRVGGWYKDNARNMLLIVAIFVSVLGNVDSIHLIQALWSSPKLSAQIATQAEDAARSGKAGGVDLSSGAAQSREQSEAARQELLKLEAAGLPIGFSCLGEKELNTDFRAVLDTCWKNIQQDSNSQWASRILGWLITAFAVMLGAPFWFDLLSRLVDIRGAGRKPAAPATQPGT